MLTMSLNSSKGCGHVYCGNKQASACCKFGSIGDFPTFLLDQFFSCPSCHLSEVDLTLTHPAIIGKEIDGQSGSHFGEPSSCAPAHDVFQVFIQMKTFLACQTESTNQFRATKLIRFL